MAIKPVKSESDEDNINGQDNELFHPLFLKRGKKVHNELLSI
jgi:hypothetical protein